ncbi:peptidase inhibitor family I36 protein [Streptomyces sudanensis]|uniref:peptidase inhibitor family I36 protein n=1 Tax=Streptomyces sudanensis TaxID=436397 RepID=UPI0020CFA87C|nr:peptidase inhibitor family I36 protein [Streptomyces sudanensis]MCP9988227.1 peptidase inhibitor family I36 protein [Streptomyces sudanensis]
MRTSSKSLFVTAVLGMAAISIAALSTGAAPAGAASPTLGPCGSGQLCLWEKEAFKGKRQTHELATTDVDSCVALPSGATAVALANRTGRPVTTYQSATCGETGEFETYPGSGTWVPRSPYQVRAIKIWEN